MRPSWAAGMPSAVRVRHLAPAAGSALLDCGASGRRAPGIDLNALIQPYLGATVVGLGVLLLIVLVALIVQSRRVARLDARLRRITQGDGGRSLEGVLEAHLERVQEVSREVDALTARAAVLEADSRRAFSRIGLVRFNPFEDTGGNQSFALALLDSREDGFVISSLHNRSATRFYAKAMSAGKPEGALSDEETKAVDQARSDTLGRRALAERVGEDRAANDH